MKGRDSARLILCRKGKIKELKRKVEIARITDP